MTRSVIDPINRIEGHLRVEMEVEEGVVTDAWVSGGLFRGLELVLKNRTPTDATMIAQRICGVCPVSHCHTAAFAAEGAYGITIPNNARIIRNLVEGAQFLHSHILWFYNLAALDYVNPIDALNANIADTYALAEAAGTSGADFAGVAKRLSGFAENGQLSIFSGNWFSDEYTLSPELNLIATTHYLEALEMQARASEMNGIMGGKMPHIMTSIPGGTAFIPTEQKLDDLYFRATSIRDWVKGTMIPDTLAIAPNYMDAFSFGKGCGRYIAWGVFDAETRDPKDRYFPAGIVDDSLNLSDVDESLIKEYVSSSYYGDSYTGGLNPREGITEPSFPDAGYNVEDRYSWSKAPRYEELPYEVGGLSRMLVAYLAGNSDVVDVVDSTLEALGVAGQIGLLQSTMGRVAARNLETLLIANKMVEWIEELMAAIAGGDADYFVEAETRTGEGAGMWEAPRGALYHYMKIENDKISQYQAIVPSTWNISPRDESGVAGPMEQALVGVPVADLEKPINALRTVHSFDPCIACAVHITEPATGKKFETVTSPWGVK